MGIAFDQTADQSGEMMAKWRTSFKLTQPEVVALADKINYLSNTGPASAQQISDIVTRIGPLGRSLAWLLARLRQWVRRWPGWGAERSGRDGHEELHAGPDQRGVGHQIATAGL